MRRLEQEKKQAQDEPTETNRRFKEEEKKIERNEKGTKCSINRFSLTMSITISQSLCFN